MIRVIALLVGPLGQARERRPTVGPLRSGLRKKTWYLNHSQTLTAILDSCQTMNHFSFCRLVKPPMLSCSSFGIQRKQSNGQKKHMVSFKRFELDDSKKHMVSFKRFELDDLKKHMVSFKRFGLEPNDSVGDTQIEDEDVANCDEVVETLKQFLYSDTEEEEETNTQEEKQTVHWAWNEEETNEFQLIKPYLSKNLVYRWSNLYGFTCIKLRPGMILIKNYINLIGQVEIVNMCDKLGGFYQPCNENGAARRSHMTCFGRNWDPITKYKNPYRRDGSEPPPVPKELVTITEEILKNPFINVVETHPSINPDVCIVNHNHRYGCQLDLHQDCDESFNSLARGLPVISISIGDTAEFVFGDTRDENKLDKVVLESGDVLIFGGKSRLIYHGVKILDKLPAAVSMAARFSGRLSVTLRQF